MRVGKTKLCLVFKVVPCHSRGLGLVSLAAKRSVARKRLHIPVSRSSQSSKTLLMDVHRDQDFSRSLTMV